PCELPFGRRQAHVHDIEALLDRPAETGQEDVSASREARAEHPDARQLAVGCERADDPGAARSVPAEIAFGVVYDHGFAIRAERDGDRLLHDPDVWMLRVDAAVEDADAYALAG